MKFRVIAVFCLAALICGCGQKKEEQAVSDQPEAPAASLPSTPPVQVVDTPVVTVNGTSLGLAKATRLARMFVSSRVRNPEQVEAIMSGAEGKMIIKQVVEQFVEMAIMEEEAKNRDIKVTDEEVQKAVAKVQSSLKPGVTIEQVLASQGMTVADFHDNIRATETRMKLREIETASVETPDDAAVRKYYDEFAYRFRDGAMAEVRHILLKCDPGASEEVHKAKLAEAEKLRQSILDGADFATLAKEHSEGPSAPRGGSLGKFPPGRMVPEFDRAVFTRKVGEIGPPVKTDFGYHVIDIQSREEGTPVEFEDIADKIKAQLERQKKAEAFAAFSESLRKKANIVYADGYGPSEG